MDVHAKVKDDYFTILVLDKNKHKNRLLKRYAKTENIIKECAENQYPFIVPDMCDPKLSLCTDFNDVAKIIGKKLLYEKITFDVNRQLPSPPK